MNARTQNERTDLFMTKLAALVPQFTDEELVGAYNVVNLPGIDLGGGEAWDLVDAELRSRDIQMPGSSYVREGAVARPPHCENCDAEAALIYDTCDHGGGS